MRKILKVIFVTFVLLALPVMAQASCNIVIDGSRLVCTDSAGNTVYPFIEEGTTYVPVRAIAQAFDTSVEWDNDTRTVHLGEKGGTPLAGENINIYYNGTPFFCYNADNVPVYPILREGTTYLPLRGMGQLFGKTVLWDNTSKTAILLTPPSDEALTYFESTVSNTAAVSSLTAEVTFNGTLFFNGNVFTSQSSSETESYSPTGFNVSSLLPLDYKSGVSYLGNGSFFVAVSSQKFVSDPYLQKTLYNRNAPTSFSNLYIYLNTNGAHFTDVKFYFSGALNYSDLIFDEEFTVSATMQYPDGFTFPLIPYPGQTLSDGEETLSPEAGENSDSVLITKLIQSFVSAIETNDASLLMTNLHPDEYDALYKNKSAAQINVEKSAIQKKLSAKFSLADGSYELISLVYTDSANLSLAPEKAAKAVLIINSSDGSNSWANEAELVLIKKDGKWYFDLSVLLP